MNTELLQALNKLFDEKFSPIHSDIKGIKNDIKDLQSGQKRIEKKLDSVVDQTADLTEFRTTAMNKLNIISSNVEDIKSDLNTVELVTSKNWNEIVKLKSVK